MAPHSPAASLGTQTVAIAADACSTNSQAEARHINGNMPNERQAPLTISANAACSMRGRPCPPYSRGMSSPGQPSPT